MEYIVKGKDSYPILEEEEKEERHQAFLKILDRIIEKYKQQEAK